jgi:polar amino acid transport system substrate-binding protein
VPNLPSSRTKPDPVPAARRITRFRYFLLYGNGILAALFIYVTQRQMRRFLSLLLATGCAIACGGAAAAATLTLCFERQQVLPWRTLDARGLNFELLDEVSRRTGVHFAYESMPWKRCLEQLRANKVDGAFAASFSPERLEVGAYPGGRHVDRNKRMHIDGYMLVRPKGSKVEWDGNKFLNLDGRVGFQLGYSIGEFLRAKHVPIDEGSQQADELAQKLVAGRLAAAAFGGADAERVVRGPLGAKLEMMPTTLVQKEYYLLLSHALVARDPKLAQRVWDSIEEVRTSPTYLKHALSVIDLAVMSGRAR